MTRQPIHCVYDTRRERVVRICEKPLHAQRMAVAMGKGFAASVVRRMDRLSRRNLMEVDSQGAQRS